MLIFTIGAILKYVFYVHLNWPKVLTIGSIISATDPVVLILLLKQMGTPLRFNILLEGESHLSDGITTVFFWVFLEWIREGFFSLENLL